jgi:hypothetical protein
VYVDVYFCNVVIVILIDLECVKGKLCASEDTCCSVLYSWCTDCVVIEGV